MSLLEVLSTAPDLAAALLDAVDAIVVVLDHRGHPVLLNRACSEATGYDLEQVRHHPFWELFCPAEETIDANAVFSHLRSGGGPVTRESFWQTRDRRRLRVKSTLRALVDDGGLRMVVCTGFDVTTHYRAHRELEHQNAELERQTREQNKLFRRKDEFLAMVSHELRTPLVTGLGYIDLLLGGHLGAVSPKIAERMKVAWRNLNRLSSLVDDILAYQRATRRSLGGALQLESVDVRDLCQECVGEFLVRHDGRADRLRLETPDGLVLVRADPDSLRRVLANLLENAALHGGANADIRIIVDFVPGRRVAVSVCDNGAGMDETMASRVFEPFVQAGTSRSGSGLGLSIVRGILAAHGTEPMLQSEPGEGTRVSFLLKRSDTAAAQPRCLTPVAVPIIKMHAHARILLVDDDQDTLEFLQLALESAGYEVATAPSAERALERVTLRVPDLFILDLSLPGQDGIRLCRRLKTDTLTAHVPIYMFTGRADEPSRRRAEAAGADGYIVKPVDARSLLRTVHLALGELDAH
jgi:PAS domain S-box-containing protein